MTKTIAVGAVLGGIVLFVWSAISWMALPWHNMTFASFADEEAVTAVLFENASGPGVYLLPNPHAEGRNPSEEEMAAMMKQPFLYGSVQPGGAPPMGRAMGFSFLGNVLAAGLMTWLLLQTKGKTFVQKVKFVKLTALFAALVAVLPNWIWWGYPAAFIAVTFLDLMIGWGLAGAAIAWATRKA